MSIQDLLRRPAEEDIARARSRLNVLRRHAVEPDPTVPDKPPARVNTTRDWRRGAVVAIGVALVVAAAWWWLQREPPTTQLSEAPTAAKADSELVVAIAGQVVRPGLVRVPAGSRVADALEAAGGVIAGSELGNLNLARKVRDGELIVVGQSSASTTPGTPDEPGLISLNSATPAELDTLPGVGPVLVERIVQYRERNGGFDNVDELREVDGIGPARFAQLKELVTV